VLSYYFCEDTTIKYKTEGQRSKIDETPAKMYVGRASLDVVAVSA
jgi:hypothetical protein